MNATAVHEEITDHLLDKLEESRFLHVQLMNRVEPRIRSRDELERYVAILMKKLEETNFRSETLLDRLDGLVEQLGRLDR